MNLNADLGEGIENEQAIFPFIDSCSIACGGHYGNQYSILESMNLAKKFMVKCGAHPSYPDQKNFGRISLRLNKKEFQDSIQKQLDLYFSCLEKKQLSNFHIKAHGALYHDLSKMDELSEWYVEIIQNYPFKFLYLFPNSALEKACIHYSIPFLKEGFLDRNYQEDGSLIPRTEKNSLIQNSEEIIQQMKKFEKDKIFQTYCLHGDHPKILEFLQKIKDIYPK